MIDYYSHIDSNVYYIFDNICGPINQKDEDSLRIFDYFKSQIDLRCFCRGKCTAKSCVCFNFGGDFNKKTITSHQTSLESFPIFECNDFCSCTQDCENRIVQKGPLLGLIVLRCDQIEKGLGLFSNNFISKGTFVCTYAGEVITRTEAERRHCRNILSAKMNYIFCLKEHSNDKVTETIIDSSIFGNIGRYINHSCNPNCVIVPVRVDTPIPKLAIFASSDIPPETEITYDYGPHSLSNNEGGELTKCLCLNKSCRQWLPNETLIS